MEAALTNPTFPSTTSPQESDRPEERAMAEAVEVLFEFLPAIDRLPTETFTSGLIANLAVVEALSQRLPEVRRRAWRERVFRMAAPHVERSPFVAHLRARPYGYAGDFLTMEHIYTGGGGAADPWSASYLSLRAVAAVRNRKQLFVDLLGEMVKPGGGPLRLLDVACGPAREVAEAVELHAPDPTSATLTLLDHDPAALAHAKGLLEPARLAGYAIHLLRANAVAFRPQGSFDLVWCAGLFDYLEERVAASLLQRLWSVVAPGGRLVVGNFHPDNPSRPTMEWLGGWFLIHRTEEELVGLARQAAIPEVSTEVIPEPLGINRFLVGYR